MARHQFRLKSRLEFETLEDRWVPANLQISNVQLLDGNNAAITSPVLGAQYKVQTNWTTDNLLASDSYIVRVSVDGIPLDSAPFAGQTGTGLTKSSILTGWYAGPGNHNITATVDAAGSISETSETDNALTVVMSPTAPTGLPANKFLWPLSGIEGKDWSVVNYNDVDPRSGPFGDYQNGSFTYDGHTAFDIVLPNFARMDAGVQVFAAAGGTVTDILDDQFDRDTGFTPGHPGNHITIDHGNGWTTTYYHIAKFTALVNLGDTVVAGQPIALVGSSGASTDAHLHFEIDHDGLPVETMFDPVTYFATPPVYEGDQTPTITDSGVTNSDPSTTIKERPDDVSTFATSAGQDVWLWYRQNLVLASDSYRIKWYRPDSSVSATSNDNPGATFPFLVRTWTIPASSLNGFPGVWNVAVERNGTEILRKAFTVTSGVGAPELHVTQGSTYIISGRTTPINFGSVASGGTAPQLTFTVQNVGSAGMNLSGLQLPPGYSLQTSLPSSVAAGTSVTFTVQLDTAVVGVKSGAIRFTSNDSDEALFWFNITGTVTGSTAANAPVLTDASPTPPQPPFAPSASAFKAGFGPLLLAPAAILTDANSPLFTSGSVVVRFASPAGAGDVLSIRNQGTGTGLIGVSGTTVTYQGATIGTATGGTGTNLSISLNSGAQLAAVQALIRNITFTTTSTTTAPRYIAITATDNTSLISQALYRTVLPMTTADVVSIAPVVPNPTANPVSSIDVTFATDVDITTFTLADLQLTRNGGANLINGTTTITSQGYGVYRIGGLSGITTLAGTYVFTVDSSGIRTPGQVPGSDVVSTTWDNVPIRPTLSITRGPGQSGMTNQNPIRFTVTFSEAVTGFDSSDISFAPGTLTTGMTATVTPNGGTGASYFVDVSGVNGTGTVGIAIPDGAASSASGGLSQPASIPPALVVSFDNVPPTPAFLPIAIGATNVGSIPVEIDFSENVGGFGSGSVQLTNATITNFQAASTTRFTFDLHPTAEGAFSAVVPAGIATDSFTNGNTTTTIAGTYDITAPTVTIDQAPAQADPANVPSMKFNVQFSESVSGLAPADISFAGSTVPGTLAASITGSGATYVVTVTGMSGDGIVQVQVQAGAAGDPAGNSNPSSTSIDNQVAFDNTAPTVTIDQAAAQFDPTSAAPVLFTVVFSEPVLNFDGSKIAFTGSTVGGTLVATVTGTGPIYTVQVTGMTGDGTVLATISAGAGTDPAGNASLAATSTDNSVRFDNVVPTAVIAQVAGQNDPASNGPLLFTITFSEPIVGFTPNDLDFSASTVNGFLLGAISGSGTTYNISVTGMTGQGVVVVDLPANRVTDLVGNGNTVATGTDRQVTFFTITVSPFLATNGVVGTPYSKPFTAAGHPAGAVPYTFSVASGTLPPGLSLGANGVLSGTPSTPGDYTFAVQAQTLAGDTGSRSYTISIVAAPIQLSIGGRTDGSTSQYSPDASGNYNLVSVVAPFNTGGIPVRTAVADINGDGVPDTILVTGPGTAIRVSAVNGKDGTRIVLPFDPFGANFTGGGYIAAADLDGDGRAEFAITPDEGGGPRVTIFSMAVNGDLRVRANFLGIDDANFRGGARPALGDVNKDGKPDLMIAAGFGGGPRVALFDGATILSTRGKLVNDFFAFPDDAATLRNGVFPALGDISGDGYADLIFGGGPGGAPRVYILSGQLLVAGSPNLFSQPVANFFVGGNTSDRGGVHVAAKDADGDAKLDLIVGSGEGDPSHVRVYFGSDFSGPGEPKHPQDIDPYQSAILADGVYVG